MNSLSNTIKPRISIVTVCRNASSSIEFTIKSVLNQTYSNYEYYIIDGDSQDDTLNIIRSYVNLFQKKNIFFNFISEKDTGMYNAMNKAAFFLAGEWVIFMNAGDEFYDENVLSDIFRLDFSECDFVYGDVLVTENSRYKKAYVGTISDIQDQSPICHQGSMIKLDVLKEYLFDESYILAADYDLMLRLNRDSKVFKKIDCIFAIFKLGGVSSKQNIKYLREMNRSRTMNEFKMPHKPSYYLLRLRCYTIMRTIGRIFFKKIFYSELRGWYLNKKIAATH